VDGALFPVYEMNLVKVAAPIVTREDDQGIPGYLRIQGTPQKVSRFEKNIEVWVLREGMCRRLGEQE